MTNDILRNACIAKFTANWNVWNIWNSLRKIRNNWNKLHHVVETFGTGAKHAAIFIAGVAAFGPSLLKANRYRLAWLLLQFYGTDSSSADTPTLQIPAVQIRPPCTR